MDQIDLGTIAHSSPQDTNLPISDWEPVEYFVEVEDKHTGALATHWIPLDERLWQPENYLGFLEVCRELLAEAADDFLSEPHEAEDDASHTRLGNLLEFVVP